MQTNRKLRFPFLVLLLAPALLGLAKLSSAQQTPLAGVAAETAVDDLDAPTDFSVTADGQVIFVAEQGAQQIRRISADGSEIVVDSIELDDQSAESIVVHAINNQQVLVGISGITESNQSLRLFDFSARNLPLDFADEHVDQTRTYDRALKRIKSFHVLEFLTQQKGLVMVCRLGVFPPTLYDIYFKGGKLDRFVKQKRKEKMGETALLSTVAVEPMGGYLAALSKEVPSALAFYQAEGKRMQSFSIDLENIIGLSFSPNHNRLFALVGGSETDQENDSVAGGIYEILTDGDACKTRFVIAVDGPQKLKFDTQGNAWVLCRPDADSEIGHLKKISGLDVRLAAVAAEKEDAETK